MIVYLSRYGSVREFVTRIVAERSGAPFDHFDLRSDGRRAQRYLAEHPQEPLVIAAPIYAGKLPGAVERFIERNRASMEGRPMAVAIACLYGGERAQAQLLESVPAWLMNHARLAVAIGGRIRPAELPLMARLLITRGLKITEPLDRIEWPVAAQLHAWLDEATHVSPR